VLAGTREPTPRPFQAEPDPDFVSIVLGAAGGLSEDNLSAYLLAPRGSTDFICLDAGTVLTGIRKALETGSLSEVAATAEPNGSLESWVLRHKIQAYLISHPHLDHVAGLIMNSPDDVGKEVYGITSTLDALRDHVFNWKIWPNFSNQGERPMDKYRLVRLEPGKDNPIAGTRFMVEPFALSHSEGCPSTAFLIRWRESYALYFGDVGPDEIEKSDGFKRVWERVAPLVRKQRLRGIFLEVSYPEGRPDGSLFGHLTPSWMMKELGRLARLVDPSSPSSALRGLVVVVTHVKPDGLGSQDPRDLIEKQLGGLNDLGVRVVMARQGLRIEF
jgi:3',5'-cyclic-nucleotide phosphodiesterase